MHAETGDIRIRASAVVRAVVESNRGMQLGRFEEVVLCTLLALGPKATASAIKAYIDLNSESRSLTAIHTTLDRMIEKGYISSETSRKRSRKAGTTRRVSFAVTSTGRTRLEESLQVSIRLAQQAGIKVAS